MTVLNAIVLAGGASRRMGSDKTSIVIDGRTLLRRSIDAVLLAGAERVVVVGRSPGLDANLPGVVSIGDSAPGSGPLGGFVDGLRCLAGTGASGPLRAGEGPTSGVVLLVASDHPDHEPDELRYLASFLAEEPMSTMAVIPVVEGRDQTLHAAYRPVLIGPLANAIVSGERSLHRALAGQVIVRLERAGERRRSYLDLDDPEQLAAYREVRQAADGDING